MMYKTTGSMKTCKMLVACKIYTCNHIMLSFYEHCIFFIFKVGKVVLVTGKPQKLVKTAKLCPY